MMTEQRTLLSALADELARQLIDEFMGFVMPYLDMIQRRAELDGEDYLCALWEADGYPR